MKVGPKLNDNSHYIESIKAMLVWNSLTPFVFQYCAKAHTLKYSDRNMRVVLGATEEQNANVMKAM
jgi:hypothetical protein